MNTLGIRAGTSRNAEPTAADVTGKFRRIRWRARGGEGHGKLRLLFLSWALLWQGEFTYGKWGSAGRGTTRTDFWLSYSRHAEHVH